MSMKREHSPDEPLDTKKARLETASRSQTVQPTNRRIVKPIPAATSTSRPTSFLSPFRLGSWRRVGSEPGSKQAEGDSVADATVTTTVVVRHSPDRRVSSDRPSRRDWDRFDAVHTAPWRQTGHGGWREGLAGMPASRVEPRKKPWWSFSKRQEHEPAPSLPSRVPAFNQDLVEKTAERYLLAVKANKMVEGGGSAPPVMSSSKTGMLPMRWSFGPPLSLQPATYNHPQSPFESHGPGPRLPLHEIPPWNPHHTHAPETSAQVSDLEARIAKLQQDADMERSILKKQIHQLQTERAECGICGRCETDLDLPLKKRFELVKEQKMNLEKCLKGKNQTIQQQNRKIQSLQDQLNNWQKKGESGVVAALKKELAELKQGIDKLARSGKAK